MLQPLPAGPSVPASHHFGPVVDEVCGKREPSPVEADIVTVGNDAESVAASEVGEAFSVDELFDDGRADEGVFLGELSVDPGPL
jgi:hypothetical protein